MCRAGALRRDLGFGIYHVSVVSPVPVSLGAVTPS